MMIYRDYDFVDAITNLMTYKGNDIEAFSKINPSSQADMGKIMKEISPKLKNKADMGEVNKIIKEKLSQI